MHRPIAFDRFYRYDDLSRLVQALAESWPDLVEVEEIGSSWEGRPIRVATVTRRDTGPAAEKPALWVDGNIHATELSTSTMCLYLLDSLVRRYGRDEAVTRCLDTRAFYICPRVNPDGAEQALAERPRLLRSSTRPYPYDEEPIEGLLTEDMDGDGRILAMRVPDPNGAWKVHSGEPRLLVRRDPAETGGQYYRLLPEGRLEGYDGVTIKVQPPKEGLDLNRNFPFEWRQENEQKGAGQFPTSEPEVRAVVDFIVRHPNLTGGVSFHNASGVLLRPYSTKADESLPAEDLWTFQKIGARGTELTGYPNVSVYHDFRYHPKEVITGGWDDWMYDHFGVFAWTVELWSPQRQAGIEEYKFIDWYREHPVGDDLQLLRWSDEQLEGKGYVDWYPYEHPQLGPVELGGWNRLYALTNPPPAFLEKEIEPFPDWLVWHLLISPRLAVREAGAADLGEGLYRLRLVVENTGWLPTYVTKKGQEKKLVRGVVAEIELPAGAALEQGKAREELGQLEGRAYKGAGAMSPADGTTDRLKVEWVVRAPRGGAARLTARHPRAGAVRAEVELNNQTRRGR
ncbi:MAG: M14 family metallopeptidase [Gemmatimonadota bacterium]